MTEQGWFILLTILGGITASCLIILTNAMFKWRDDLRKELKEFKEDVTNQVNRVCAENDNAHGQIWERINHHHHTIEGNVVIPSVILNRHE